MTDATAAWSCETKQAQAGAVPDPATGARATPIYQTTTHCRNSASGWTSSKYLGGHGTAIVTELFSLLVDIGEVRSLIVHPASTTHRQLSPDEQAVMGVTPGLVRLSVGIEGIEHVTADLEVGFRAAEAAS